MTNVVGTIISHFTPLTALIAVLWVISASLDYLGYTYFLQLKEYRLDRLRDFFKTSQGKNLLLEYKFLWRPVVVFALYFVLNAQVGIPSIVLYILIIDLFAAAYKKFIKEGLRRPVFTAKSLAIIALSLLVELILVSISLGSTYLLLILVFRAVIISSITLVLGIPTKAYKMIMVAQAKRKIARYKDLRVIGITGSYGKSTSKNFLYQILRGQFKVVKTPGNINTEIGVARHILKTDFNDIDIYIVEMGAYRKGEISLIADMVKPSIGILTAINEQHMSLFGDIRKTQEAKYELLRALPKDGIAVVNGDNQYCTEFLSELSCQSATYGTDPEAHPTLLIEHVEETDTGIKGCGTLTMDGQIKRGELEASVIGIHNAMNIAPCIIIAAHFGMKLPQIMEQARNLKLPRSTFHAYTYGKATILDDTYNSNPDGFKAALDVLSKKSPGKEKIVVTRGMIELGESAEEIHERIAGELAFYTDELVIISPDYEQALRRGIDSKYRTKIYTKYSAQELLTYVQSLKERDVVVLLENRVPQIVLSELTGTKEYIP